MTLVPRKLRRGQVTAPDAETAQGCGYLAILSGMTFLLGGACMAALLVLLFTRAELARVIDERQQQLVTVPVLNRELQAGSTIEARYVTTRTVTKSVVPSQAAMTAEEIIGRTVSERVLPGEYVRLERLAARELGSGLHAIVPERSRAVALKLRDDERVGDFLQPGNRVDLLVTLPDEWHVVSQTITVAQNLRVLAIDETISTTATGEEIRKPQVTLAVPIEDAERVVHAVHLGESKLTLRSDIDIQDRRNTGARVSEILGGPGRWMSASEFHAHYTAADVEQWVEIIHGGDRHREPVIDPSLLRGIDGSRRM